MEDKVRRYNIEAKHADCMLLFRDFLWPQGKKAENTASF
jgi:hypothetical protein